MGYVAITAKIMELLGEISGIEKLYAYNPNELEVYPAVTVTAIGHKNRHNDTASNIRSYQYLIRVFYRLDQDDDAEGIVQDLTDQITEKLEANVTSNPEWHLAKPTEAVFRTGDRELPILVSEITAIFETRVNR